MIYLGSVRVNVSALVIDDEPLVRNFVALTLRSEGWDVDEAATAEEAFQKLKEQHWTLVFSDVNLGGVDGYAILRRFSEEQPEARVVMITGDGSAAGALDATAIGAYDYLVKPFGVDEILTIAHAVREQTALRSQHEAESSDLSAQFYKSDIPLIGRSPGFVECLKLVGRVSPTNLPVLIAGESGTGKEIVARAIHQRSNRASGSFVAVNCGAIPDDLIESELFGHAKGAFTGADRERVGLWEEADGGAIFLDEITETSPLFQVKILRALQENEIRRVGSNKTQKVDVRVIAATNRDIEGEVKKERFRQDLMYRLNAVTIHLPPLRERAEDIPLLAEHFASRLRQADSPPITFSRPALEMLKNYDWTGNIRELENAILHAASLSDDVIYPEHLPARIRQFYEAPPARLQMTETPTENYSVPLSQSAQKWLPLAEMEAKYVAQVLVHTGGNKQAAARLLDIDRKTLMRIIKRSEPEE